MFKDLKPIKKKIRATGNFILNIKGARDLATVTDKTDQMFFKFIVDKKYLRLE